MSFHTVVDFALNFAPLFESCSTYCDLLTFLYCFICSSSSGKKNSVGSVSDAEESPKHKPSNNRASSALSGQIDPIMPVSPIKSSKSSDTIDGNANPAIEIGWDFVKKSSLNSLKFSHMRETDNTKKGRAILYKKIIIN